jgi:RimJ/RimL family protein N-acetyltransferase
MDLSIRQITPGDWLIYKTMRLRALQLAPDSFGGNYEDSHQLADTEWKARVQIFSEGRSSINFIASLDSRPAGMASCYIIDKPQLMQMWIEPIARGKSVGDELVNAITNWLQSIGKTELYADVFDTNLPAHRLYLKLGFEEIDRGPSGLSGIRATEVKLRFRF